jgi:hypothetical protein
MRITIAAAALVSLATSALAADTPPTPPTKTIYLPLSDGDFKDWSAVSTVFDQCVSAASLRSDVSVACRQMSGFLRGFADRIAAVKPAESTAVPPIPSAGTPSQAPPSAPGGAPTK